MYCPNCKKPLPKGKTTCKHCGTTFNRESAKMARQMTVSGRFAMACGGLMILLALLLFLYGGAGWLLELILCALGALLIFFGKKIN